MSRVSNSDLYKIGAITLLGLTALIMIVFWLKGHKLHYYDKFSFYFKNVNGLEEGNALRWNGLKIGVVESIKPVTESFEQEALPSEALIDLGKRHLQQAIKMIKTDKLEDLVLAQESINNAQLEITLGKLSLSQAAVSKGDHVEVKVVVTMPDVPIGALNQVTIAPSGLIGEQFVDISTINIDEAYRSEFDCSESRFVVLEPIRLDRLIRVNAESAEAITNLTNRVNALFTDEDADNIRALLDASADIVDDPVFKENIKQIIENLNNITKNFKIWKLF